MLKKVLFLFHNFIFYTNCNPTIASINNIIEKGIKNEII